MIVCLCKVVSDSTIRSAIGEGHHTLQALARKCGAGTGDGCGGCSQALRSLLKEHCPAATATRASVHAALTLASDKSSR